MYRIPITQVQRDTFYSEHRSPGEPGKEITGADKPKDRHSFQNFGTAAHLSYKMAGSYEIVDLTETCYCFT